MDIKSKKFNFTDRARRAIVTTLLLFFSTVQFFSGFTCYQFYNQLGSDLIDVDAYYDTQLFRELLHDEIDKIITVEMYYQSEEDILARKFIDKTNLVKSFIAYYGMNENIITSNTVVSDTYDSLILTDHIPSSLNSLLKEYETLVETRLPEYVQVYTYNQLYEFRTLKNEFSQYRNLCYYIEDTNENFVAGNISESQLSALENKVTFYQGQMIDNMGDIPFVYENALLYQSDLILHVALRQPLIPEGLFYEFSQEYAVIYDSFSMLFLTWVISTLLMLLCVGYLFSLAWAWEWFQIGKENKYRYYVDTIYKDIHTIFIIFFFFAAVPVLGSLIHELVSGHGPFFDNVLLCASLVLYLCIITVFVTYISSIVRQFRNGMIFKNTFVYMMHSNISKLIADISLRGYALGTTMVQGVINFCLLAGLYLTNAYQLEKLGVALLSVFIVLNVVYLNEFFRSLYSLQVIMTSVKETCRGNLDYKMDLDKISSLFVQFATDISDIQTNFKEKSEAAVSGERMRAELITNVSHDLKTPLTSIITYADILKNHNLTNEQSDRYVQILYDKSHRLKQLIEDLIEASKASSGMLKVLPMPIDLYNMTMQCVYEVEDKFRENDLEIVLNVKPTPFIYADGRHLARIIENLTGNALKYSLKNSHVYVDVFTKDNYGAFVLKNTSATVLNFNESEFMTRFFRGDAARTTEGSGLGLSIAQSLTELQNGIFELQIDGDLFKVTILLPLYNEDMVSETEESSKENL
ncbi:MAG: HAMP domain-containing sensor histidine kinase [Bacillota bacterium]